MDSLKIDYHLSYYRLAREKLSQGIEDPQEFQRQLVNRDAAMCAIALEIGLIQDLGNCNLSDEIWNKAIDFIRKHELQDREIAA